MLIVPSPVQLPARPRNVAALPVAPAAVWAWLPVPIITTVSATAANLPSAARHFIESAVIAVISFPCHAWLLLRGTTGSLAGANFAPVCKSGQCPALRRPKGAMAERLGGFSGF